MKYFYTFVKCRARQGKVYIFDESVSLLSLTENLTVQKSTRIGNTRIICLIVCGIMKYPTHIIQVWGLQCLFVLGFCQNLLSDKRLGSTLSI